MQVQCDVNYFLFVFFFFLFFHFFQIRCPVNNAMSHPVVRNKLWLIAVVAVILKKMGETNDFKDALLFKHLFEITIILHKCDCFGSDPHNAELRHALYHPNFAASVQQL